MPDIDDADDDADGVRDEDECDVDSDNDGQPDSLDIDDDASSMRSNRSRAAKDSVRRRVSMPMGTDSMTHMTRSRAARRSAA